MYDGTPSTIAYLHSKTDGRILGRVRIEDDHDAPCTYEGPHEYYEVASAYNIAVRVGWSGAGVRDDWYENDETTGDDRISEAWDRFAEEAATMSERVDLFLRYMRTFHPLTPVVDQWIQTGYSQGDSVRLIGWAVRSPKNVNNRRNAYQWATDMHENIVQALEFIGGYARGQFVSATYEEAILYEIEVDDNTLTAEIEWLKVNQMGGIYYSEEFEPVPVVLESLAHIVPFDADTYDVHEVES